MDFKQPYNHQTFLHFLQHNFLPDDFEILEEDIDINFKTQFIKKAVFLGKVNSLGLSVYEAYHHSENDPRVSLSSEIFRLLADYGVGRALVVFVSSKSPNYRFSLVTIDLKWEKGKQIKKEYSNPRRYSFYLGPDAKVHTAHDFLVKKGKVKDFEGLIDRFNVEVVTKEFFQKYHELFEKLTKYLEKDNAFKIFATRNNISIENFAKKLLGQIVFIYFLQRKGWLGARREDKINQGDKDFLRHLFDKSKLEGKNFFNNYLESLFYNALNQRSKYAGNFYRDYFGCQIPFLNGGLFEPLNNYDWENEFIHLPDKLFSNNPKKPEEDGGILDIFDLYNFTVAEDDSVDKEVSIDPEMLGKVFENLLEENLRKGKGTYYTPREIVHYMCRESLINYLATEVNLIPEDVRNKYFPPYNVLGDKKFEAKDVSVSEKIIESLKNIKVVDPACGSGAFLVGMLQQITKLRFDLESVLHILKEQKHKPSEYEIKKETIQNCIYGVDIDPGAVEIAKLRLWLSLVVDYELDQIEPLPNLDYKIMVGNSLIDKAIINDNIIEIFNPADLEEFRENKKFKNLFEEDLQGDIYSWNVKGEINILVKQFIETKDLLFRESDFEKKLDLKNKINQLENEIIRVSLKKEFQKVKDQLTNRNLSPSEKIHLEFNKKFLEDLMENGKELDKYKHENIFLWQLNFIEVFREKGGFDVVIANPPYVRQEMLGIDFKRLMKQNYPEVANGVADLYVYFFAVAFKLIKARGVITYITPNKYLKTKYGFELRNTLKGYYVDKIIDFFELPVFEAANDTAITIIRNESVIQLTKYYPVRSLKNLDLNTLTQDNYLTAQKNDSEWVFIDDIQNEISKKIYQNSIPLKDFVDNRIYSGIKTALNEAFVLSKDVARELLKTESKTIVKKYAQSTDIKKWKLLDTNKFFLAAGFDIDISQEYPSAYSFLKQYEKRLKKRLDKGRNWWNLRSCKYYSDFERPKIIYMHTAKKHEFYLDTHGYYINNSCYMLGSNNKFLLCFLNSRLFEWFKRLKFVAYGDANEGGRCKLDYNKMITVPIKVIKESEQRPFIDLVDKILDITQNSDYLENPEKQAKVKGYEKQIDQLVYKLYDLTPEEIAIVEDNK